MTSDELHSLKDLHYGELFDVERSASYHRRRRAFFEKCHFVTSILTVLMAGSYVIQAGINGNPTWWLQCLSWIAGTLALIDLVVKYPQKMADHLTLQKQFDALVRKMKAGPADGPEWSEYSSMRSVIEDDEPPVYKVVDALARNELLIAKGVNRQTHSCSYAKLNWMHKLTANFLRWENYDPASGKSL